MAFNTTLIIGMNKIYMYTNERERERRNVLLISCNKQVTLELMSSGLSGLTTLIKPATTGKNCCTSMKKVLSS